ncbi:MAG: DEAD/DEAH box helicase [Candidatus Coatesbacteria bacterium]|nr:MAG: DEAD/DEAH box helicase [Candidatus Coatesbacteria bacterium]
MKIDTLLAELQLTKGEAVRHVEHIPAREARFASPEPPLAEPLAEALRHLGITSLYSHQAAYVEAARAGQNVVAVTPTASGKTLCFLLPVLEHFYEAGDQASALFLYPTKALSQDQLRNVNRFLALAPPLASRLTPGVYDGDTPPPARRKLRDSANLLITNPDMLHTGILPHHARWGRFFSSLRYVVVDELHAYRGIFGSHVANVLRRLRRIASHYGASPQFLLTSATIANPREHAERLVGGPVTLIDDSGAPQGDRYFVILNPPLSDRGLGLRRSANVEAAEILQMLVQEGVQSVTFARARVVAELIYKYAKEALGPKYGDKLRSYRGGYLPQERREIEQQLFGGQLLGVTATNALELGIDVGGMDAAVVVGFPGSIASLVQQSGRAGRRAEAALAVLVAYDDPVDQYLARHPSYVFGRSPEEAIVDPENVYILSGHLRCAAAELPLTAEDLAAFGASAPDVAEVVAEEGDLAAKEGKYWWLSSDYPAANVNLRSSSDNTVTILEAPNDNAAIGTLDYESALEQLYPEAIYLQQGETYFVRELDLGQKVAFVERRDVDYYTQAMVEATLRLQKTLESHENAAGAFGLAEALVTWRTVGFKKIKFHSLESIGWSPLELPAVELETVAFYVAPGPEVLGEVQRMGYNPFEGLVGLKNALLAVVPLFAMCDPRDLRGVVDSSNLGTPAAFLYDIYPGGLGYAEHAYRRLEEVLRASEELIAGCECDDGCPSCVGVATFTPNQVVDPDLRRGHYLPHKEAALALARALLT